MAIVIHLPDSNRSITIDGYTSLAELYRLAPTESVQKLATSHLFFRHVVAFLDVLNSGEFNQEEVMDDFKGIEELDTSTEIGQKVFETVTSDEFEIKYSKLFENMSHELFDLYASGAAAVDEQQVAVGILSTGADGRAMQA